ncbi:MAG: carbamoyltransferase HypF [Deltaproteobacteria bacterium]|nr:carbamoyltransferase HypF [Deltaproteobacteria bacterium]MBZ0219402.1 carbamoyltransferase HypF [Deltaproteobacteria bacterium]
MESARIQITGIVQGVGFRPYVYGLASRHSLKGFCLNDSEGVVIEVQGASIDSFLDELRKSPPPLARIDSIRVERLENGAEYDDFIIRESRIVPGKSVLVSPDMAVCPDCLSEMLDPSDRRHLYPFINCTNCGPRYSIVLDIPYDRPNTTMAGFTMCPECEHEYHDPADRRFHAQPTACPACGPSTWLHGNGAVKNYAAIVEAGRLLKEGTVVAVKGLGGFHLACDAMNSAAVSMLRERKRRSNKPFALMVPDIRAARLICEISPKEEEALLDRTRPIVLLKKRALSGIDEAVAPGNSRLGVMLPYTPLHHLLFRASTFKALVMTSGNLSEEPIVISNSEALEKLSRLADSFLLHDRDIYMRVDDSIARVQSGRKALLRRARGHAPEPIDLGLESEEVFAAGALLKNTFCLTKGRNAILSQHMGDLENFDALEFYRETLRNLKNTFRAEPTVVAHDLHPDYLSTRFALEYAKEHGIPDDRIVSVQHHHAHVASAMAEHGLSGPVIGVSFDGTGLGTDGNIWGGEFLIATRKDCTREAHLRYMKLPGGDTAAREPWRMALSCLLDSFGSPDALRGFAERIGAKSVIVAEMIRKGINAPLTSSMGRLFDAAASIAGVRDEITFEAEAAIEFETIASEGEEPYPFELEGDGPLVIDTRPLIMELVKDANSGTPKSRMAGRFHSAIAGMALRVSEILRDETGINDIVLSGGVFQNRLLSELTEGKLKRAGFETYRQERVPANDGGISLGQAAVAIERTIRR